MYENGDITLFSYQAALRDRSLHLKPGRLYTQIREPYFFSYVRDQLIAKYGAHTVRSGGLRVYTTIVPVPARGERGDHASTLYAKTTPPPRWSRSTRRTARSGR